MERGQVGELVLRQASIGMTKSLWKDDDRYLQSYWSAISGLWLHGDFAMRGEDGLYYILGRSDDTIKVSGKRVGPSEIEGFLTATGKVSEAGAFGVTDPVKGSTIVCACILMPGFEDGDALKDELSQAVVKGMGASYRPGRIIFVDDLPRTRNMKIMRRVLRAVRGNGPGGSVVFVESRVGGRVAKKDCESDGPGFALMALERPALTSANGSIPGSQTSTKWRARRDSNS